MSQKIYIGTDSGATTTKFSAVYENGDAVSTKVLQRPTNSQNGRDAVVSGWIACVGEFLAQNNLQWGDVAGVGWAGVGVAAGVTVPPADVGVLLDDGLADRAGLAERAGLAVRVGAGEYDRVGVGAGVLTGPVCAGVGFGGSVVPAGAGRTTRYRANTPANSPMSTMVEVRGRLLMTRSRSPGRCQARRPR